MATELRGTLARQVKIGDTSYKVELSATGWRLTEKRKRRSAEISWQTLVALGSRDATRPAERDTAVIGNSAVSADVAKEIRTATKALERARDVIAAAGGLPAVLVCDIEPDPVHGLMESREDWFVEPLLTLHELASILRVAPATARSVEIPSVIIFGEIRFRAITRARLPPQERAAGAWSLWRTPPLPKRDDSPIGLADRPTSAQREENYEPGTDVGSARDLPSTRGVQGQVYVGVCFARRKAPKRSRASMLSGALSCGFC
jgi:hypothetical protein